jgi:hypothetical protein
VFDADHAKLTVSVQEFERHDKAEHGNLPPAFLLFIATVKRRYHIFRLTMPADTTT